MMESCWSFMPIELLDRQKWKVRVELANAIFYYIEIFHEHQRHHSALYYRTPIEYELSFTNGTRRRQLATTTRIQEVGQVNNRL